MDGWMDGWMDEWMMAECWMNGSVGRCMDG